MSLDVFVFIIFNFFRYGFRLIPVYNSWNSQSHICKA